MAARLTSTSPLLGVLTGRACFVASSTLHRPRHRLVSNRRNPRRSQQRVRYERSRKPVVHTKAMDAFVAAQPLERERKERIRYYTKPTKAERQWSEKLRRRWALRGPRPPRKPRTKYGHTFWTHSLDV